MSFIKNAQGNQSHKFLCVTRGGREKVSERRKLRATAETLYHVFSETGRARESVCKENKGGRTVMEHTGRKKGRRLEETRKEGRHTTK